MVPVPVIGLGLTTIELSAAVMETELPPPVPSGSEFRIKAVGQPTKPATGELQTVPVVLSTYDGHVITLSSTLATIALAAGDRLSFTVGGTVGSAAGVTVSVGLVPI